MSLPGSILRRLAREERGQVLPMLAMGALVTLLGIAALVIDWGNASQKQRQLQASADAAALAGASTLPDTAAATATAHAYGPGGANPIGGLEATPSESIAPACSDGTTTCAVKDVVRVSEDATVPTAFGSVIGVDGIPIHAQSAAVSSDKVDVMILLDRTESMCQDDNDQEQHDVGCPDLAHARAGISALLQTLDPRLDRVALAVLPPAVPNLFTGADASPCDTTSLTKVAPFSYWSSLWYGPTVGWGSTLALNFSMYYSGPVGQIFNLSYYDVARPAYRGDSADRYLLVPFSSDYRSANGGLDTSSQLVSTLNCIQTGGGTAYAEALQKANDYLQANARPDARKVIVFMSDGGANMAPRSYYPNPTDLTVAPANGQWSPYILYPCGQAVAIANQIRQDSPDTRIFTIGYDVGGADTPGKGLRCYEAPHGSVTYDSGSNPQPETDGYTARSALENIASPDPTREPDAMNPDHVLRDYWETTPTETDLTAAFTAIAHLITPPKLIG